MSSTLKAKPSNSGSLLPAEGRAETLFLTIENALKKFQDFGFDGVNCKAGTSPSHC